MRLVLIAALALGLGPTAFSQHSAGAAARSYSRGGGGRRYYGGGAILVPYPAYVDPFYASYGGVYGPAPGAYDPGYDPAYPPPQPPTVIINQNFQPETIHPQIRDYTNVQLPEPGVTIPAPAGPAEAPPAAAQSRPGDDQQPNVFLIALKDQSVLAALAYWVQDDTLNYITLKGAQNRVSLSLVDRELSMRLNNERQVQFRLPAAR